MTPWLNNEGIMDTSLKKNKKKNKKKSRHLESVWHCVCNCVSSNFENFFFFTKIECGLYFLDRFDMLMSKMIFKK
jgi:hypothetical protein